MRLASLATCLLLLSAGCLGGGATASSPNASDASPTEAAPTPAHPETASSARFTVDVAEIERLIHEEMNERRRRNGVDTLAWNQSLQRVARYKSWDMAQRDYFEHTGPNGTTHHELRARYGTDCTHDGQNIYISEFPDWVSIKSRKDDLQSSRNIASDTVNLLLNSSGHRENALDPDYDSEGIGVFVDGNGSVYVTQELCG